MLSVVIPTLNSQATLEATLAAVNGAPLAGELVVADGGSVDGTVALAVAKGAAIVAVAPSRGGQLAAGAERAGGDWLLFLHADSRLADGWQAIAGAFMAAPENARRAGYFRLRFDASGGGPRRVERLANWRARALGLPYGDQGLLIATAFYRALGGYRDMVLMEDVDLVRRIGRARLVELAADAVTGAGRYQRDGWWARPWRNLLCVALYFLGLPPRRLWRFYHK